MTTRRTLMLLLLAIVVLFIVPVGVAFTLRYQREEAHAISACDRMYHNKAVIAKQSAKNLDVHFNNTPPVRERAWYIASSSWHVDYDIRASAGIIDISGWSRCAVDENGHASLDDVSPSRS